MPESADEREPEGAEKRELGGDNEREPGSAERRGFGSDNEREPEGAEKRELDSGDERELEGAAKRELGGDNERELEGIEEQELESRERRGSLRSDRPRRRSAGQGRFKFADRREAGEALARCLIGLGRAGVRPLTDAALEAAPAVVLALPRGGVPVAFEVARALAAPLDVLIARKIGAPGNPELGIGAVAEGGVRALAEASKLGTRISAEDLDRSVSRAEAELEQNVRLYRDARLAIDLRHATAIVIDDGLATGGTATAAVMSARRSGASSVVLAVPVGAKRTVEELRAEVDALACVLELEPMWAIGMWYEDFSQVSDAEVIALLRAATRAAP